MLFAVLAMCSGVLGAPRSASTYEAGVSYLIDTYNFSSPQSAQSLAYLKNSVHARSISVIYSWYQATINSTQIGPVQGRTPSDEDVRQGVVLARAQGFKVRPFAVACNCCLPLF